MKNTGTDKFLKLTKTAGTLFLALLLTLLIASGCAMLNGDDAVVTTAPTYTISGTVISPVTKAPAAGVTCSLSLDGTAAVSAAADVSKTATTDQNGVYTFTGVPSGKYKIKSAGNGLIAMTTKFSVNSNTEHTIMQPAASEWTKLAGDANPYDQSKAYLTVHSDAYPQRSIGTEDAGVIVELKKTGATSENQLVAYEAKGHFNSNGSVDWTATQTYDNGMTIFKGVTPNQAHTVTAQKAGFTFASVTDAAAAPGEITNLILAGAPVPEVKGFPVTIINNSGYKTEEVYLAIIGQDKSGNHYYFDKGANEMKIITGDPTGSKFNFSFSTLKAIDTKTFQYTHPFDRTIGCKVYLSFKNPAKTSGGLTFGVNNNNAVSGLAEPSAANENYDKYTIFDKFELTCNGTSVIFNTTTVDFIAIGIKFKFNIDNIEKGFNITSNQELFDPFLARKDGWEKAVVKDAKGNIMRVLAPNQAENSKNEFGSLE